MKELSKTQILFVRACKSNNAERRLKRLYKSIYFPEYSDSAMLSILLTIVENHNLVSIWTLVKEYTNPEKGWQFGSDTDEPYETRMVKAMTSIIRLTAIDKLPGYVKPLRWRKHEQSA